MDVHADVTFGGTVASDIDPDAPGHLPFDDFDRIDPGPLSWGTATGGVQWEMADFTPFPNNIPTVFVDGTWGRCHCTGVDSSHRQGTTITARGPGPWQGDFVMTMRFKGVWSGPDDTARETFHINLDDSGSEVVMLELSEIGGGRGTYHGMGVAGNVHFDTPQTIIAVSGQTWMVKWQHAPDSLGLSRMKVWLDGTAEPTAWYASRPTDGDDYNGQRIFNVVMDVGNTFSVNDFYFDYIHFEGPDAFESIATGWAS